MDQQEHSSEQGKFMAVRAASGALRGVAQHGVTPLCTPLSLPSSHHHDSSPKLLDCHFLPPFPSHATSLGSCQPQQEQPAAPGVSWGHGAAQQQRGHIRTLAVSPCVLESPLPQTSPGGGELGVVLLPSSCYRTPQQTNKSAGNNSPQKA